MCLCLIKEVIRRRLNLQEIVSTFGHDFAIKANQMHYCATESHILQQAHGSPKFTKPDLFKNYRIFDNALHAPRPQAGNIFVPKCHTFCNSSQSILRKLGGPHNDNSGFYKGGEASIVMSHPSLLVNRRPMCSTRPCSGGFSPVAFPQCLGVAMMLPLAFPPPHQPLLLLGRKRNLPLRGVTVHCI